jgi:ABC-2 type transport system ATP-binding protein
MTVGAFLDFIARVRGFSAATARSRIDRAVAQTALESVVGQKIDTLSKGFRRRVGLAQAILHDPPVLILDEPTDGLDPNQKHQVRELIRGMARDKAIVVSTHILEEVEAVCTRAVVIDRGRIVADGTAEELQRRSPEHNAVSMRVAPQSLDALKAALGVQTSIIRVEEVERSAEGVRLRAYPRDGGSIAAELSAALKARDVVVSDMTVERGRLDDVFRDITSKDTTHAATARRPGAPHA